jgi:hypothetical protein
MNADAAFDERRPPLGLGLGRGFQFSVRPLARPIMTRRHEPL